MRAPRRCSRGVRVVVADMDPVSFWAFVVEVCVGVRILLVEVCLQMLSDIWGMLARQDGRSASQPFGFRVAHESPSKPRGVVAADPRWVCNRVIDPGIGQRVFQIRGRKGSVLRGMAQLLRAMAAHKREAPPPRLARARSGVCARGRADPCKDLACTCFPLMLMHPFECVTGQKLGERKGTCMSQCPPDDHGSHRNLATWPRDGPGKQGGQ